jgi:type IV pilus assembly protein PilN
MIRVNLLPHRELRRRRQQKQFFTLLGGVIALGAAIWLLVHTSLANKYEDQLARNKYLQGEIAKLDKEIEDIRKLREMTASLLARKKVVETLQTNRSEVVYLLDELPRQLPDGIYLKGIKQQGPRVTINGYTQSQARVSTLMRNLEGSPHLENANLVEIKAVNQPGSRVNEFSLNVNITRPKEEIEEKSAKGAKPPAKSPAAKSAAKKAKP